MCFLRIVIFSCLTCLDTFNEFFVPNYTVNAINFKRIKKNDTLKKRPEMAFFYLHLPQIVLYIYTSVRLMPGVNPVE
ncbi:hypothetical protein BEL04_13655 [Mucilaginibacter sp. PPCGB 2223]|nr:hypothetical protein BEL04_13655 [Mucilaginibacter sp. PPCGB 2223]